MVNLVLLGPPGVGKGTYAKELSRRLGIPHISTGDIFREEVKKGTPLGLKVKEYLDRGVLVPDSIVNEVVKQRLSMDDCRRGFILDGYPRTLNQAKALDSMVRIDAALYFTAPKEVIIERVSGRRICPKCGAIYHVKNIPPKKPGICDICGSKLIQREDDKPEVVERRLRVYEETMRPVIEYYRSKGLLIEVDASEPVVERIVLKAIEELKRRNIIS
ncbi:MAG TPA: adenylate kinase [Desulfurococcales archaeon]|nr:adenylate kinase [Desulfurococcales archaeon]